MYEVFLKLFVYETLSYQCWQYELKTISVLPFMLSSLLEFNCEHCMRNAHGNILITFCKCSMIAIVSGETEFVTNNTMRFFTCAVMPLSPQ